MYLHIHIFKAYQNRISEDIYDSTLIPVSGSWCFDHLLKYFWLSLSIIICLPRWSDTSGYHGYNLLFIGLQCDDVVHIAMLSFIDKYSYSVYFPLCILDLPR